MHITSEPIRLTEFLSLPGPASGAMASFLGIVRDHDHGRRVKRLYYECYPSMAEKMVARLIEEARWRWPVQEIRVVHRVGELEIGEVAVAIAVGSAHRDEAFRACRFLIEEVKHRVPVWKKQIFEDGSGEWVLCRHAETEEAVV